MPPARLNASAATDLCAGPLPKMQKGKPAGGDAGAAGGGAGKAPADAESAARLAELKRQVGAGCPRVGYEGPSFTCRLRQCRTPMLR